MRQADDIQGVGSVKNLTGMDPKILTASSFDPEKGVWVSGPLKGQKAKNIREAQKQFSKHVKEISCNTQTD